MLQVLNVMCMHGNPAKDRNQSRIEGLNLVSLNANENVGK